MLVTGVSDLLPSPLMPDSFRKMKKNSQQSLEMNNSLNIMLLFSSKWSYFEESSLTVETQVFK